MLLSKTVKVKWGRKNKSRLISLGYEFHYFGEEIEIPIEHVSSGCNSKVLIKCDYCGKEFERGYRTYYNSHYKQKGNIDKDACTYCSKRAKREEVFNDLYGATNMIYIDGALERRKQTCLEKYGVEEFLSSKEVQRKIKNTVFEKYGVEYASQSDICKEHYKENCMKKYGVDSTNKLKSTREKYEKTMLEKYGVKVPMQNEQIKEKTKETCIEKYGEDYGAVLNKKSTTSTNQKIWSTLFFTCSRSKRKSVKDIVRKRFFENGR